MKSKSLSSKIIYEKCPRKLQFELNEWFGYNDILDIIDIQYLISEKRNEYHAFILYKEYEED